jgi:hypothetical protein
MEIANAFLITPHCLFLIEECANLVIFSIIN